MEKKKTISASDSAEIVKGEKIFADIDLVISSVTGMSVDPLEHEKCHKLFAEAAGAINILTNLNKGDKFVEGK